MYIFIYTHTKVFYLCFDKHVVVEQLFSCSSVKSASGSRSFAYTMHEEKWKHFKKASADHSDLCFPTCLAGSRPRISQFCPGIPEIASEILDRRDISSDESFFLLPGLAIFALHIGYKIPSPVQQHPSFQFIILELFIFNKKKIVSSL